MKKKLSTSAMKSIAIAIIFLFSSNVFSQTVPLGTAQSFALLSADSIVSSDSVIIYGDAGATSYVSNKITGGTIYTGTPEVATALIDLTAAMVYCTAQSGTTISGSLGGQSLAAGVYKINTSAILDGTLTLTGDTNAVYIFNITDSLIALTSSGVFRGDVRAENIFWNVSKSAVIEKGVGLSGIVMAGQRTSIDNVNSGFAALLCLQDIFISRTIDMPGDNMFYSKTFLSTISSLMLLPSCSTSPPCNLICNPSFEQLITPSGSPSFCGSSIGLNGITLGYSASWSNPTSGSTPDLYNTCNTSGWAGVPNNYAGFQAASGTPANGYAGIVPRAIGLGNYREYLKGDLTTTLIAGKCYYYEMQVSAADKRNVAVVELGAAFTATNYSLGGYAPLPLVPQVQNCSGLLTNCTAWTTISGTFTAIGGENKIYVGNFNNDAATTTGSYTPCITPAITNTYYYIDNLNLAEFTVDAGPDVTICAGQSTTLTATVTACAGAGFTYTWSPTTGIISGGSTATPVVSPATTTTYTVSVSGTCGSCSITDEVTVIVNPLPVVTVNSPSICIGQTATLTAMGATTYTWSAGVSPTAGATVTATPTATTSYTVTGTNTSTGCTNTAVATVTVNPLPIVAVNSPTICVGQTANLTATGAATYTWSAGVTVTGVGTGTASPSTTTTYTVTGANATGCTATAISTVTVNPLPIVSVNSPTICAGQTANLTAAGATTYTWSAGATSTGVNTADASPIVTTTYTVTGTSAGCSNTAIATVTVNPLPTVTVNSPTICIGQTANLTASGAVSYTWSAGATSTGVNTADASPTVTTTYTVTGTDANGCTNTAAATVTIGNPSVTVNSPTICNGQTANLTANGATTYTWSVGATSTGVNTATASPSTTTTYTVTGTTGSCTGTAIATVTVNPVPVATATPTSQTFCSGDITGIALTSVPVGATFAWTVVQTNVSGASNGGGSSIAQTLTTTTFSPGTAVYTITPTLAGCAGSPITVTITVNPNPDVNVPANIIYCVGNIVPASAFSSSVGGTTYAWTNSNTATGLAATSGTGNVPSFTATNSGTTVLTSTITVTPTDPATGCVGTPTAYTITVNPRPAITSEPNLTYCAGDAVPVNTFASTTTGATFTWTNSDPSIGLAAGGSGNTPAFTATNGGTTPITATITVTASLGVCVGMSTSFTITVNPIPTLSGVPSSANYCDGDIVPATSITGSVSGTTFSWTNSNIFIGLGSSGTGDVPSFTASSLGTTTTGTITITPSANGCSGSPVTYTITVSPYPIMSIPTDIADCPGVIIPMSNFISSPAGATFTWTNSNTAIGLGASGSGNVPSFTLTNATVNPISGTITVTPTFGGCVGTPITYTITVFPSPTVVASASPPVISLGGSSTLTASGGATYVWSTGATTNPISVSPSVTTTYTVTGSNQYQCTSTGTVTVTVVDYPCTVVIPPGISPTGGTIPHGANSAALFGSTASITGNFKIAGTFLVNSQLNFVGCNIIMEASGSTVPNIQVAGAAPVVAILRLSQNTHIYSCTTMWDGIYVHSGGKIISSGDVIIEDGIQAVNIAQSSSQPSTFTTTMFNKNLHAIKLTTNANPASPITLINSVVTCRQFIYTSTVPSTNPTVVSIKTDLLATTPSLSTVNLRPPYSTQKAFTGVFATDVSNLTIGDPGAVAPPATRNVFDAIMTGINISNPTKPITSTYVYHNVFQFILGIGAPCGFGCTYSKGFGINASGMNNTAFNMITVGGTTAQGNLFRNIYIAVYTSNYQTVTAQRNSITNISTGPFVPIGTVNYGNGGIFVAPAAQASNILIADQTLIKNCATAIWVGHGAGAVTGPSLLRINNNGTSTSPCITSDATATTYCTNGIYVTDLLSSTTPHAIWDIKNNFITATNNCIFLSNVKKPAASTTIYDMFSNSCRTRYYTTGILTGIKAVGSKGITITNNHTNYTPGSAAYVYPTGNITAYGLYLQSSSNMFVGCNLFENA